MQLSHRTRSIRVCHHVCVCDFVSLSIFTFSFHLNYTPISRSRRKLLFVCGLSASVSRLAHNATTGQPGQTDCAATETRFPMIFQTGYVSQKCRLRFALKFSIVVPIVIRHLAISVSFALAFNMLASPTHFMLLPLFPSFPLSLYSLLLISIIMVIGLDLCVCFDLAACHLFLSCCCFNLRRSTYLGWSGI